MVTKTGIQDKPAACQCLFCLPLPPLSEKLHAVLHDHKINTGKGVGELGGAVSEARALPVEGVPQELLQGQKFTVVSISPFSNQSGNRNCMLTPQAANEH